MEPLNAPDGIYSEDKVINLEDLKWLHEAESTTAVAQGAINPTLNNAW